MGILRVKRLSDGFNVIQLENAKSKRVSWLLLPGPFLLHEISYFHPGLWDQLQGLHFISFCFVFFCFFIFFPLSLHLTLALLLIGSRNSPVLCVWKPSCKNRTLFSRYWKALASCGVSILFQKVLCVVTWGPDLLLWSIYSELSCQGSKPQGRGIFPLMPHKVFLGWYKVFSLHSIFLEHVKK